jgi:hypothetical protein
MEQYSTEMYHHVFEERKLPNFTELPPSTVWTEPDSCFSFEIQPANFKRKLFCVMRVNIGNNGEAVNCTFAVNDLPIASNQVERRIKNGNFWFMNETLFQDYIIEPSDATTLVTLKYKSTLKCNLHDIVLRYEMFGLPK